MTTFRLALAAVALTFGAGAAQAELKVPDQYPISTARTSVDQVGAGRLVDSRSRLEKPRVSTKRSSGKGFAQIDKRPNGRESIFGE